MRAVIFDIADVAVAYVELRDLAASVLPNLVKFWLFFVVIRV